jgi:hypothetical protein
LIAERRKVLAKRAEEKIAGKAVGKKLTGKKARKRGV